MGGWRAWAAVAAVGVLMGVGDAVARPVPALATVPVRPIWAAAPQVIVPCAINAYKTWCVIDTGNAEAITVSPGMAAAWRLPEAGHVLMVGVGGGSFNAARTSVRLTVGGRTITAAGAIAQTGGVWPLVGLPALQRLAPGGLCFNWRMGSVSLRGD